MSQNLSLDPSQFSGAVVVNIFALLSAKALLLVGIRVGWLALKAHLRHGKGFSPPESAFFQTRMGVYAVCLLTGNLFSSIAGVIGIAWVAKRMVIVGSACTAQAVFMSMGNSSTAYFIVAIAVHSFISLVLRRRQPMWTGILAVAIGWTFAFTISLAPLSPALENGAMYGPGDLTCGVQSIFIKALFYHHLLPILLASILSTILYSVIFLVLRGTLTIHNGLKLTLTPTRRWSDEVDDLKGYHRFILAIARTMLWYPVAYVILLFPYSITRLLSLSGFYVPTGFSMFAFSCWYMLGVVNVVLLYNTFRVLVPAFELLLPQSKPSTMEDGRMQSMMTQTTPTDFQKEAMEVGCHIIAHHRSATASSIASSTRGLISNHPSTEEVNDSRSSAGSSTLHDASSPLADLYHGAIVIPEPVSNSPDASSRPTSINSTLSLSAVLRSTRTTRVQYPEFHRVLNQNGGSNGKSKSLERQDSAQSFPRDVNSVRPSTIQTTLERDSFDITSAQHSPETLDISGWLAQQPSEDFVPPPRPPKRPPLHTSQPSLTAVSPTGSPVSENADDIVDGDLSSYSSPYAAPRAPFPIPPHRRNDSQTRGKNVTRPEPF